MFKVSVCASVMVNTLFICFVFKIPCVLSSFWSCRADFDVCKLSYITATTNIQTQK